MISFLCPHCGYGLNVPDQYAGRQGKCTACGNAIVAPYPKSIQQPAPPPLHEAHGRSGATKNQKIAVWAIVAVAIFVGIPVLSTLGSSTPRPSERVPTAAPVEMPLYEVVNRDIYDAPIKTEIALSVVVSGTVTESGIKQLIENLYDEANATRGFKYHGGKPTHVFIYLYTSEDHFKSGMAQWIAMLSKVGDGAPIDIEVRTELIAQLDAPPEVIHGLSEAMRKEVFLAMVRAEDQANAEAEQRYPDDPMLSMSVGDTFTLSKQTPLMPELEPADPLAALQRVKQLPRGTRITVLRTEQRSGSPWYEVRVTSAGGGSLGTGWVNSAALMGQSTLDPLYQLENQAEMSGELTEKYTAQVAEKYGLTEEQLDEITVEAFEKNWPFPPSP